MGKALRIGGIVAILGVLVALVVFNASSSTPTTTVWDANFTKGSLEAKNHYIMYTDLMCPYCDVFSRVLAEHEEEFQRDYIEGHDILFEIRMTDFLYQYGSGTNTYSQDAAEASYCAAAEGKFWEFYHGALQALWKDYHSKGIGVSKTSPKISGMTADYWLKVGKNAGVAGNFEKCYTEHEQLETVRANTEKAAKIVGGGVPYFKFNKFTSSGFDQSWGWDYVRQYLDAGLKS